MKTGSSNELGIMEVGALQASVGSASGQATASTIAHKYRRALKNGTGANLTLAELQLLAHLGALDLVTRAENEELTNWQGVLARTSPRLLARPTPRRKGRRHLADHRKVGRQMTGHI